MSPTIEVDWRRLESGVFENEGDICAAYSAETLAMPKGVPRVKVFSHDGTLWTTGGGGGSCLKPARWDCHQLIPASEYTGTTDKVPYSYQGMLVQNKAAQYRLGPQVTFLARERTIEEWLEYLRIMYRDGGAFTSNRTYHQMLRDFAAETVWNCDASEFEPIKGNIVEAIRLELERPDFTKHEPMPDQQLLDLVTP